ncbi:CinA [Lasiodiplodia theobromae]|uniref:CinA-like protein n=1 Tax=Lasiodiplodia theobromae TaxID=45133 RepID=A0A5N5D615_9PEZI|nr:Competence damage-inducible protein [Lasiodiplodia theobromae]KAB2572862.1 CinA-like protein [Lasiodiplodia theobromae]KAF4537540.1 Competence damage-inducible protein [Lasiodiplodia theobromae]KAF9639492.1 CinA [Lasiodiplodia theobromae]
MPSKVPEAVFPPLELREIVYEIVDLLKDRGETISCGETAAGGLISAAILSVPGASAVYKGGLTLYTLESRLVYGGWTQEQIDNFTGPSIHCVLGLAEHVRGQLGSTYAVAESGSAGPSNWGKTDNMKAGYVALAVASASGCVEREIETGLVDRDANMVRFAVEALRLVKDVIQADMARFSGWLNC